MNPIRALLLLAVLSLLFFQHGICPGAEEPMSGRKLARKIATLVGIPFYGIAGPEGGKIAIDASSEDICYLLERAVNTGFMVPQLAGVSEEFLQFRMTQPGDIAGCVAFRGGNAVCGVIVQRGDSLEVCVIYDTNANKIESVSLVGKDKELIATEQKTAGLHFKRAMNLSEVSSLSVIFSSGYSDALIVQLDDKGKVIDEKRDDKVVQVNALMGADGGLTIEFIKTTPSKYKDVAVSQFSAVDAAGNGCGHDTSLNGNNGNPLASVFVSSQRLKSFSRATCRIALDYSNSQFAIPCSLRLAPNTGHTTGEKSDR